MEFVRKWAGLIALLVLISFALLRVPRGAAVLAVVAAGAGLYWLLWSDRRRRRAEGPRHEPEVERRIEKPAPSGPPPLMRSALQHVDDVRLAAVILMIQLVRTSAPLTAAGRTLIYDFMADPLEVEGRHAMFEEAWQLTDRGRVFSPMADDLVPLFLEHLTLAERFDFIDMLVKVAGADGKPSDLQVEAITRLRKRLTAGVEELGPAGKG